MNGRKTILGGLLATLLLGLVEGVARLAGGPPPPSGSVVRLGTCRIEVDRLVCPGAPEQDIAIPPKSERPRVVVLGGSTVRNPFNPNPDADFPTHLARAIPRVEVLNLGCAGLDTAGVWALARQLPVLAPDLVVLHTGHNDYNATLFQGRIRAMSLWSLPVEQALSASWIRAWLTPIRRLRDAKPASGGIAVEHDIVRRVRPDIDARFRDELTNVVRASPAPVVLTTLLRNFDEGPNGVDVSSHPTCASILPRLPNRLDGASGPSIPGALALAEAHCGDTSVTWWLRAHAEADPSKRAHAWRLALALDAAPVRAPLSADDIVREVAAATGASLADLARDSAGGYQPGTWFYDPLHTDAAGAGEMARALCPVVTGALATNGFPGHACRE